VRRAAQGAVSWSARDVVVRHPGAEHPALDGVTLDVPAARLTALLGPNGAGKSTLLHVLLGTLRPTSGEVHFRGRPVREWPRRALACEVGVVTQAEEAVFPTTARELVAMGRYAHAPLLRGPSAADERAVDEALARCDVGHLAGRAVHTLSGGERQRVRVARALAQIATFDALGGGRALVLDEPTAALDVRHEMAIFELLRALARAGTSVLLVTHHLNLAARYADHLVLLHDGRVAATGPPAAVLTLERVERVYGWPVDIVPHPGPGPDAGAPQVVALASASLAPAHP
jgi:iron complex transport system ATP-binding protein